MQALLSKALIVGGYLLVGIAAFCFFLYRSFPFHAIQETGVLAFEAKSGCRTDVGRQTAELPLVLKWHDIEVRCPNMPLFPIEAVQITIAPRPLLFQQTKEIAFQVRMPANMGEMTGRLAIYETPSGPAFSWQEEGKKINLYPLGLMGQLHTKGSGHWTGDDLFGGRGSHTFTLEDLRIDLQGPAPSPAWVKRVSMATPFLGTTALSFSILRGDVTWQSHAISIKTFYAEGELVDVTQGAGSVLLRTPVSDSTISLTLTVVPHGNLKQMAAFMIPNYSERTPLTLVLTGPFSSPKISLNGIGLPAFS